MEGAAPVARVYVRILRCVYTVEYRPQMAANQAMPSEAEMCAAFGEVVAEYRHRLHLSQEKLALKAELDRTFVGKLEKGRHSPSLTSILKLATALEVGPDELVREVRRRLG